MNRHPLSLVLLLLIVGASTAGELAAPAARVLVTAGATSQNVASSDVASSAVLKESRPIESPALGSVAKPAVAATVAKTMPASGGIPRSGDQLWLVSDRGLGCGKVDQQASNLKYWHYVPDQGWRGATSAEFFAGDDPTQISHIWIHGNRISHGEAFQVGWTAHCTVARQAADQPPLRFIIWSWPSERIDGGQLEDVRVKAERTGVSSPHLARFIDAIRPDVRVTISGYSFGARIATGSLHLLAGGALGGRTLAFRTAKERPPFDVVLMAAAVDCDWIIAGNCHGKAMELVDRLLLINNSCDRVLEHYHLLYGLRSSAEALGNTGLMWGGQVGNARTKVAQFDACCYVGPEHDWSHYFCQPAVVGMMVPYVFGSQPVASPALAGTK